jgi:DNA-binding CsgD family transcriptional regulator
MDVSEAIGERRRVLRRLMERTRADAALFHRLVRADGATRIVDVCAVGSESLVRTLERLEGEPASALPSDVAHALPIDAFGIQPIDAAPATVRDTWWSPSGICDVLGTNVCRDATLVGVVYLFRCGESARFTTADVGAANGILRWARAQLESVAASDTAPKLQGSWVFDFGGRALYTPLGANPAVGNLFAATIRAALQVDGPTQAFVAGHAVTVERLAGPGGGAVLLRADLVKPVVLDEIMHLTPLKRRIAAYAAQGATVAEIADVLGRSPETVRTHLKRIYEQLGVASRLELAEACRAPVR